MLANADNNNTWAAEPLVRLGYLNDFRRTGERRWNWSNDENLLRCLEICLKKVIFSVYRSMLSAEWYFQSLYSMIMTWLPHVYKWALLAHQSVYVNLHFHLALTRMCLDWSFKWQLFPHKPIQVFIKVFFLQSKSHLSSAILDSYPWVLALLFEPAVTAVGLNHLKTKDEVIFEKPPKFYAPFSQNVFRQILENAMP